MYLCIKQIRDLFLNIYINEKAYFAPNLTLIHKTKNLTLVTEFERLLHIISFNKINIRNKK